ncbi:hypothetical protein GGF46_005412 [Coemansia sp. RSA 552]|nr:hypothetical protein GGF46_005412 [Coemansia sp. RSA 552]
MFSESRNTSNAELLIDNQATGLAQRMHISIQTPLSPLSFYCAVAETLDFQGSQWGGARSLTLEFANGVMAGFRKNPAIATPFMGLFSKRIPGLQRLDIVVQEAEGAQQCELLNTFADVYVPQLRHFSADIDMTLHARQFSEQLTSLQLSMTPLAIQTLPRINPEMLQRLSLFDVAANFKWNIFSSVNGVLRFSNLRQLSLGHKVDDGNVDRLADDVRPQFPVLQKLHVFRCPPHCVLLNRGIYPKKLDRVAVECPPGVSTLARLRRIVPSSSLVVLVTELEDGSQQEYQEVTNSVFSGKRISDKAALIVMTKHAIPDPMQVQWTNLSTLYIRAFMRTTVFLGLLDKLPGLQHMSASKLVSDHHPEDVYIAQGIDARQKKRGPHIETKITTMCLSSALDPKLVTRDIHFVLYVATAVHTLTSLETTEAMKGRLRKGISKHTCDYPHLALIKI